MSMPIQSIPLDQLTEIISRMNSDELETLKAKIEDRKNEIKKNVEKIFNDYGHFLSEIIGAEKINSIPEADPSMLEERFACVEYPCPPSPSEMRTSSVMRGKLSGRSFLVIKIVAVDKNTGKIIDISTELIFQRYSDWENNFVTSTNRRCEEDSFKSSYLYSTGGMSRAQMIAVKDLIEGKKIVAPEDANVLLRLESDIGDAKTK